MKCYTPTRWLSSYSILDSLSATESAFKSLIRRNDVQMQAEVKAAIINRNFRDLVLVLCKVMKPLSGLIKCIESSYITISEAFRAIIYIYATLKNATVDVMPQKSDSTNNSEENQVN